MRTLVTGAAGFIGSFLVRDLAARGHTVRGADRASMEELPLAEAVEGDLAEPPVARRAVADVDRIYHLAASRGDFGISDAEYHHNNVKATRALLEAGAEEGGQDWIFYSTVAAMGPGSVPRDETAELRPTIPYGRTKAEAEGHFRAFSAAHPSARILILRPSVVYGPGHPPDTNIYRLIEAISSHRFVMVGEGETRKTTSYIENLLAASRFLTDRLSPGVQVYIYVDAPVLSTGTLVERIYRLLDRSPPSWHLPLWLARPVASVSDVVARLTGIDLPVTAARIEKFCTPTLFDDSAIRELGFEQPVSNEEALRRTVAWHEQKM